MGRREGRQYPFLLNPVDQPQTRPGNDGRLFQHFQAIPHERCRILNWIHHGPDGTLVETEECRVGSILDAGELCEILVSWPQAPWWRRFLDRWWPGIRPLRPVVAAKVQVTADTPGRLSDYWIPDESES